MTTQINWDSELQPTAFEDYDCTDDDTSHVEADIDNDEDSDEPDPALPLLAVRATLGKSDAAIRRIEEMLEARRLRSVLEDFDSYDI